MHLKFIRNKPLLDLRGIRVKFQDKFVYEEAKVCVSPPYIPGVVNVRLLGKSLMYNRNKSGPKIDP